MDSAASGGNPHTTGTHRTTLTDAAVRLWGTPTARDEQRTPAAAAAKKASFGRTQITALTTQAKDWPTPTAHDAKGPDLPNRAGGDGLWSAARGHQDETTTTDGPDGSPPADLNPRFVEALMGVPQGWLTPSTSVATASFLEWLAMHSSPSRGVPVGGD